MKIHDMCHKIFRSNKLQADNCIEGFAKAMNDFDYKKHDARRSFAPSYEFVCSTLPGYKVRKCEEDFLQYTKNLTETPIETCLKLKHEIETSAHSDCVMDHVGKMMTYKKHVLDELKRHVKDLHPMHDTKMDYFCSHFDEKTKEQCSKHFSLFHNRHKHDTVLDRCADLTTNALETFESCVDVTIRERRAFKETMHLSYREPNH